MDFVHWLAQHAAIAGGGDRAAIIAAAVAVLRFGGRGEFEARLNAHRDDPDVQALREEWEKTQ